MTLGLDDLDHPVAPSFTLFRLLLTHRLPREAFAEGPSAVSLPLSPLPRSLNLHFLILLSTYYYLMFL